MYKILLPIIFLFVTKLFPSDILIDSKIFPAIIKYDLNIDKKLINNRIKITIVYHSALEAKAEKLKSLILKKYDFDIELLSENNISNLKETSAMYLFELDREDLQKVLSFAKKREVITFANKLDMLEYGVAISISNQRRPKPIINKRVIRSSNISLSSTLLKASVIYE